MTNACDMFPAEAGMDLPLDEAVCRLADANDTAGLGAFIASRAGLDPDRVIHLLTRAGEGPIALVARTAGLTCNGYSAVLRLRRRLSRNGTPSPATLLTAYSKLPRPTKMELAALLLIAFEDVAA